MLESIGLFLCSNNLLHDMVLAYTPLLCMYSGWPDNLSFVYRWVSEIKIFSVIVNVGNHNKSKQRSTIATKYYGYDSFIA